MAECEFKPYCTKDCNEVCNGDCNECKYKETIEGAVIQLKKALFDLIEPVMDVVNQFIKIYAEILKTYGNNHVAQLATNHKKKRVRKKNRNRIFKWIKKGGKKNG